MVFLNGRKDNVIFASPPRCGKTIMQKHRTEYLKYLKKYYEVKSILSDDTDDSTISGIVHKNR